MGHRGATTWTRVGALADLARLISLSDTRLGPMELSLGHQTEIVHKSSIVGKFSRSNGDLLYQCPVLFKG